MFVSVLRRISSTRAFCSGVMLVATIERNTPWSIVATSNSRVAVSLYTDGPSRFARARRAETTRGIAVGSLFRGTAAGVPMKEASVCAIDVRAFSGSMGASPLSSGTPARNAISLGRRYRAMTSSVGDREAEVSNMERIHPAATLASPTSCRQSRSSLRTRVNTGS